MLTNDAASPKWTMVGLAATASFATYFCMYVYRKSISAATFDGLDNWGISFKSSLIIAQVFGYMLSKFIGIRFMATLNMKRRPYYLLGLIGTALVCLAGLAFTPMVLGPVWLFLNGLSLGLIWGLVFSYIEGRKYTDLLALILSTNFIFSSGMVKSLGRMVITDWGVEEARMPFYLGCLFIPLLLASTWLLAKIPPPNAAERLDRGDRLPMDARQRSNLVKAFFPMVFSLVVLNIIFTILRDLKDNYAVEIIRSIHPDYPPSIFARMETLAAIVVFLGLLTLTNIRNHYTSLKRQAIVILAGISGLWISTGLMITHPGQALGCMVTYTICLYSAYNTLQCLLIDRLLSCFRIRGNTGYLFYIMDAMAYLGSCIIIIMNETGSAKADWYHYFVQLSLWMPLVGMATLTTGAIFIYQLYKKHQPTNPQHVESTL
ncbi:DUF5690 family protein [Flavihumibacter rivuli]|uniref:DUF5690 family protein n=1 Tax=Flavihumibacter rivuli TaxID=2838156 RepID=UPI001BDF5639|nr:DUF5690 family protein [Flavihumibacter rivuli]ULQ57016.1 DUF5690 family protein [Flavihumibacter rivuli]